jgi:hypothetical protein
MQQLMIVVRHRSQPFISALARQLRQMAYFRSWHYTGIAATVRRIVPRVKCSDKLKVQLGDAPHETLSAAGRSEISRSLSTGRTHEFDIRFD